ncbi:Lrp/AsnC family transcriptional regulator [Variovorax sp. NFACC27]|jgi:Lrp/AsnC family leucine-responsive transcriptional regulator|uniref:Lrp/AsnC family transcriptional regulator n=1 Tax=unclassified Variovorax TaxID=663243 RepID=UPI0008948C44|nr:MULTISPECIES: Lrp/AsnC family transcriptional regulator [unclassified Variovorax]MDP9601779.1 Lrp/AsnC family leucine-responsive transcriptional regulator [Variovorax paradoxus]SEF22637.1 Lrp/AsnC family transcriptional regulator, leucine-responsive regulatory protein [Variovorax sp. NFACC28]SEG00684.1 Lrp/AsnC family transcriptional regulator, leucine-responsive regulatory protein [Variovorax sp. NFACC29]SFB95808.1 Lrp/AsnC family transcriptional regulator, leucine-responsive regulatory pro
MKTGTLDLDRIDQCILAELQADAGLQNQTLAERVNLSPSACLKRVQRLRRAGVIREEVAILDAARVGFPVLVISRVALRSTTREAIQAFERKVHALPQVLQCHCVAGDTDFVLVICARSLPEYQAFAQEQLGDALELENYSSDVVLSTTKFTTQLPLDRA